MAPEPLVVAPEPSGSSPSGPGAPLGDSRALMVAPEPFIMAWGELEAAAGTVVLNLLRDQPVQRGAARLGWQLDSSGTWAIFFFMCWFWSSRFWAPFLPRVPALVQSCEPWWVPEMGGELRRPFKPEMEGI